MTKAAFLSGLVVFVTAATASAVEFPLTLKTMNGQEAMALPGGSGAYGQLEVKKPSGIKAEPKVISGHPLYGRLQFDAKPMIFRLDESQGEGKGYDRLILDLNRNNDLTDDPVAKIVEDPNSRNRQPGGFEQSLFGPIEAPASMAMGQWKPRLFAQMYLFTREFRTMANNSSMYLGQLRVRPGCYMEAKVELAGVTQRIGLIDGNGNMQLGDLTTAQKYFSPEGNNWYFNGGDTLLRDRNNSGQFDADQFDGESETLGKLVYFGSEPYNLTWDKDFKSINLESYSAATGELAFGPHGDQIKSVTLGWETTPGKWEPVIPSIINGKAKVPVGNYRVFSCVLAVKNADGTQVMAGAYKRVQKDSVKVEPGQTAAIKCGAPLELQVTANKQRGNGSSGGGLMGAALSLFAGGNSSAGSELRINMTVTGAGGESFSGYVRNSKDSSSPNKMPRPEFTITGGDGKKLASGNLEFG